MDRRLYLKKLNLSKVQRKCNFSSQELKYVKKAYNSGLKDFIGFNTYLHFLLKEHRKIKKIINNPKLNQAKLRGGIFGMIAGLVGSIVALAATSAPVVGAAIIAAAPTIASAAITTGTEMLIGEALS